MRETYGSATTGVRLRLSCESHHKMPLFSGSRRRMLASQIHDPCIIGLDIAALIGLSPLSVSAPWFPWALSLVLQTSWVFAGPGVRYHRVLYIARLPDDLDIQSLCRLAGA